MNKKPDFIIIGAMKSGTTTLHRYLLNHPGIFMTVPKEPGFFSREHVFNKGFGWYASLFENAKTGQFTGEASTCYSRWPAYNHVPERLYAHNKSVKLIYILRHPVSRAYSHYGHLTLHDKKQFASFEDALQKEQEIILSSKYMLQINKFLDFFPKEQLLLIDFEDLMNRPQIALEQVQHFLGCEQVDLTKEKVVKANIAGESNVRNNFIAKVRKIRNLPGINFLVDKAVPKEIREKFLKQLVGIFLNSPVSQWLIKSKKNQLSPLTTETRAQLLQEFNEDVAALEKFWARDLSAWYK